MNIKLIMQLIAGVSSEYDEKQIVSNNTFLHAIKVKFGGRSRAMSTPWCWKAVDVKDDEEIVDRISEQIVHIPVPQLADRRAHGAYCSHVNTLGFRRER